MTNSAVVFRLRQFLQPHLLLLLLRLLRLLRSLRRLRHRSLLHRRGFPALLASPLLQSGFGRAEIGRDFIGDSGLSAPLRTVGEKTPSVQYRGQTCREPRTMAHRFTDTLSEKFK